MKITTRWTAAAAVSAALLLGSLGIASAGAGFAVNRTTLPKQTHTHFFEIYHCGELAGVVWVTPDEAALFRLQSLSSPQLRAAAFDVRAKAREEGNAFAVHGGKGNCTDV